MPKQDIFEEAMGDLTGSKQVSSSLVTINASQEVYEVLRTLKIRCDFPKIDSVIRYFMMHLEPKVKNEIKEIVDFFKIKGIQLEEEKVDVSVEELTSELPDKDDDDANHP